MKAIVDRNTCTGCGLCVDRCPEVFELDKDWLASVKTDPVPPTSEASCREAAEGCPVNAISIQE